MRRIILVCFFALLFPVMTFAQENIVDITTPLPVSEVTGTVSIHGSASASDFQSYFLEVSRYQQEPPEWIPISLPVSDPVIDGVLAEWNTALLPDGVYRLRLHVLRCDGDSLYVEVEPLRVTNGLTCPVNIPPLPECVAWVSTPVPVTATTLPTEPTLTATPVPFSLDMSPLGLNPTGFDTAETSDCTSPDETATYNTTWEGVGLAGDMSVQTATDSFSTEFEKSGDTVTPIYNTTGGMPSVQQLVAADVPAWLPADGGVLSLPESGADERVLSAWNYQPATPETLAAVLGEDVGDIGTPEDGSQAYVGERTVTEQLPGGVVLTTTVRILGVYDGSGQLVGSLIMATYTDCKNCPAGIVGAGWTSMTEQSEGSQPSDVCLPEPLIVPSATPVVETQDSTVPGLLNCLAPDFYATYSRVSYEGMELHLDPGGIFVEEGIFYPYEYTYTIAGLNPDSTLAATRTDDDGETGQTWGPDNRWNILLAPDETETSLKGSENSYSYDNDEGGTLTYTHVYDPYTMAQTGTETITIAGYTVEAIVIEGEQIRHNTATDGTQTATVDVIVHYKNYYDAQTGLPLRWDRFEENTNCVNCIGAVNGSTLHEVTELIATNQPLGSCGQ